MRLLFIQNVAPSDPRAFGGQRIHHELTLAMAARGHDARAVFLTPNGALPDLAYPAWAVKETGRLQFDTREIRRTIPEIFRRWTPDVLYGGAAESAGAVEWARGRCRTAATSHHYDPPDLTRRASVFSTRKWIQEYRSRQRFRLERRMLRAADLVLATSSFGANALKSRGYVLPDTDIPVLLNGVSDSWFRGVEPHVGDPAQGFLFVGRMDAQKGVDVLLKALAIRAGKWPVTLIGGGWMEDAYRVRARELGVTASVTFLGPLAHAEVQRRASRFGAFVLPSRAENCPLVLLEAMAAGLAVISTDVGGIPELVTDSINGLLVPAEDAAALAAALDRVELDPELRARLASGGRVTAEHQRWNAVAERLEQHFS